MKYTTTRTSSTRDRFTTQHAAQEEAGMEFCMILFRVLYGAVFPIGSGRFGAVNRTEPHRRIFALFKPNRTAP